MGSGARFSVFAFADEIPDASTRDTGRLRGAIEAKGEALSVEPQACIEAIQKRHPTLLPKARCAIEACEDHARLCDWMVKAPELDAPAFGRHLGIG